ncbi:GIY-YIG nuclease family protein [Pseudodesulfovibrio indicus]|uniref:Endonuclease n=1 Tax=Pseudodesulfovibrio indicus TaxID=1716143 RepID=A0A126QP52_9BACT|nr:GIY-YIG nuclease family protein [Pseudodesulfovibrio indicus]AMK11567.1 excinuclease ABC subunit C [Pseudodesulfovibrio indicus]TDT89973.1 putative endonuclease [Pseudodesulfovibrio indicus]
MGTWHVYLLRCADRSLYCGITNDLERRVAAHNAGKGSKYTRARLPVTLAASTEVADKSTALKLELAIKKLPAGRKMERLAEFSATL